MTIKINRLFREDTAWNKRITIERDGVEYLVFLSWDMYQGYDLSFLDGKGNYAPTPDWVVEWEESQQYGAESFEYFLDSLSEEALV